MTLQTFEGAWEDIQVHANEFIGHQVRVTVLDSVESKPEEKRRVSLAEKLRSKVGTVERISPNLSENTGEKFASLITQKYLK